MIPCTCSPWGLCSTITNLKQALLTLTQRHCWIQAKGIQPGISPFPLISQYGERLILFHCTKYYRLRWTYVIPQLCCALRDIVRVTFFSCAAAGWGCSKTEGMDEKEDSWNWAFLDTVSVVRSYQHFSKCLVFFHSSLKEGTTLQLDHIQHALCMCGRDLILFWEKQTTA